jgi:predicted DNA-binding WGR domain protein
LCRTLLPKNPISTFAPTPTRKRSAMSNEERGPRSTYLRREQEHRMARFYTMHLAPTLFGGRDLVREWGHIGSPGTLRIDPFKRLEESERALPRIETQKRKRAYP